MSRCSPPLPLSQPLSHANFSNLFKSPKTKCETDDVFCPATAPLFEVVTPRNDQLLTSVSHFLINEPSRKSIILSPSIVNPTRPVELKLTPLTFSPAVDLFVRLNNGIRQAFTDFFEMSEAMCRIVKDVRTSHLKLFFRWWQIFASFLSASIDAYKDLLLPWVQLKAQLPDSITVYHTEALWRSVKTVLDTLEKIESQVMRRPPDETVPKIVKALSGIPVLFQYLTDTEKYFPVLLREHYTEKEVSVIEKKLFKFLQRRGSPLCRRMHLLVLARGMTPEEVVAWKPSLSIPVRMSLWAQSHKFQANFVEVIQELSSL